MRKISWLLAVVFSVMMILVAVPSQAMAAEISSQPGKATAAAQVLGNDLDANLAQPSDLEEDMVTPLASTALISFAVVRPNATLARGFQAISSSSLGVGFYDVRFNRDVRGCSYVATIGDAVAGPAITGQISVSPRSGANNGVFIRTTNSSGTQQNLGFHLYVACP